MIPRQKRIDASHLPGQHDRFAMADLGHAMLTGAGYRAIGFDHFALPGDPMAIAAAEGRLHRNFQGFTDDASPVLLGLGASAISMFSGCIIQNEKNLGRYRMRLSQMQLPAALGVRRSARDQATGRIIEAILCQDTALIGTALGPELIRALNPFIARGLALRDQTDAFHLKESNKVESLYMALLDMDEERFESIINNSIINLGFENTIEKIVFPFFFFPTHHS